MRYQLNKKKLKDVVSFVVSRCAPHELGAVKLHKVLYYADMLSYLDSGKPMTGATYRKRPFGPTCDALLETIAELKNEGALRVEEVDHFGYLKKEFHAVGRSNQSQLTDQEISVLETVIPFVCHQNTAKSISEFSHDIVWNMVDFGQDIPYHLALSWLPTEVSPDALSDAKEMWLEIEDKGPVRAAGMDSEVLSPLRARLAKHSQETALS